VCGAWCLRFRIEVLMFSGIGVERLGFRFKGWCIRLRLTDFGFREGSRVEGVGHGRLSH